MWLENFCENPVITTISCWLFWDFFHRIWKFMENSSFQALVFLMIGFTKSWRLRWAIHKLLRTSHYFHTGFSLKVLLLHSIELKYLMNLSISPTSNFQSAHVVVRNWLPRKVSAARATSRQNLSLKLLFRVNGVSCSLSFKVEKVPSDWVE